MIQANLVYILIGDVSKWFQITYAIPTNFIGVGQGQHHVDADEAPSLDIMFPRAAASSLAIDSNGVIMGVQD